MTEQARPSGAGARSPVTGRILCVDDDAHMLSALWRQLRRNFDVVTAESGESGLELLHREGPFAVVLSDYGMPGMNGVEFLRRVKALSPETVTAMLTGIARLDVAVSALHEGHVYRFLTKPWESDELEKTLRECLEQNRRVMERHRFDQAYEEAQNEIIRSARMDTLTGIFNRGTFEEYHESLHRQAIETGSAYALFMADVDNFKKYNDNYGHPEGDRVLRAVATALREALRDDDFIARYGGEEIVVLCEGVDEDTARRIGERLCSTVWKLEIPHAYNADHGRVTVSLGGARCDAAGEERPANVVARADAALYEAKRHGGRNRVILAAPVASRPT